MFVAVGMIALCAWLVMLAKTGHVEAMKQVVGALLSGGRHLLSMES